MFIMAVLRFMWWNCCVLVLVGFAGLQEAGERLRMARNKY